jgi:hypothetical protein
MKNLNTRYAATVLFAFVFPWLLAPDAVQGQQAPPPPPPRRPAPSNQPATPPQPNRGGESVNQRALDLELLSTLGRRNTDAESYARRLAAQLVLHLERLWEINTETIVPLSSAKTVDYKNLSQAAAEIKDRATRIKNMVALPLEEKKGERRQYEADAAKLGSMLSELDRSITSFFGNPVFHINSPNDAELRSAAGRDLEAIIKLSQTINKIAKSMGKSTSPNK